jgi:hypothetical protein
MADVFISYAHRNLSRVEPISTNVEEAGLSLWWDKRLMPGDDFTLVIERELGDAKCVVVAWSKAARDSLWVRAEATEALDAGKIVQVRLDGVKPPLPFTVVEMLDLSRWRGDRAEAPWPKVESAARALAGGRVQAVDSLAFGGPALQDMGSTAALGWLSIGLIAFTSTLTLQLGANGLNLELYRPLTAASFAIACVAFALTFARIVRTILASIP